MKRLYVDCRDTPASGCTVAISADSEKELLDAAMEHAVKTHGFKDTPEVRAELRKVFKEQKQ
jgi:predicted small metal-binding protein